MLLAVYNKVNFTVRNVAFNAVLCYSKNANKCKEENIVRSRIFNIEIPRLFIDEYVWQKLDKWQNKTALVCAETGRSYLYSELYQKSRAVSSFLTYKVPEVKQKDVIAIILPNIPEYPMILLGIIQAGFKVTTVNYTYTAEEMSNQLLYSDARFVFTSSKLWPHVHRAIQTISPVPSIAVVKEQQNESLPAGAINFSELVAENTNITHKVNRDIEDVAIIPFSSGTTGLPKGVELTHKNVVSNLCQTSTPPFKLLRDTEGSFQEVLPLVLPIFHSYGMVTVLLNALSLGCKIITISKFVPQSFIDVLEMHHPTFAYLAPPLVLFLVNNNKVRPEHIKYLKTIVCSAAPIGAEDIAKLNEKSSHTTTFLQKYGMTEASPETHTQTPYSEGGIKMRGSGLVVANTEFLVIPSGANHRSGLGPNISGEVLIRGPQVMKGYYKNPEATQAAIDKYGWLRTGDIAYYDEDGHLFVTDRLKELIKVKGFQVAPAELEAILRSHPDIEDAAVIGVPHATYGEVPKAFVVSNKNSTIDITKIQEFVASKVTSFKHLKGGILVLDSIPKSASGKILRRELRNLK